MPCIDSILISSLCICTTSPVCQRTGSWSNAGQKTCRNSIRHAIVCSTFHHISFASTKPLPWCCFFPRCMMLLKKDFHVSQPCLSQLRIIITNTWCVYEVKLIHNELTDFLQYSFSGDHFFPNAGCQQPDMSSSPGWCDAMLQINHNLAIFRNSGLLPWRHVG